MREATAVVIGYLLGSVLPAYLLGRARGIDLRETGEKNAGTTNAFHVLGLGAAIPTALYDVSKGLLAMLVATWLGVAEPWVYAAGVAAIVGHRFPVWLRFRGAQGMAASVGLLFYGLVVLLAEGWLSWLALAALAGVVIVAYGAFRSGTAAGVIVLPVLGITAGLHSGDPAFTAFFSVVVTYMWLVNLRLAVARRTFHLSDSTRRQIRHLRVLLRPFALAFPVLYLFIDKRQMLLLVGSVTLFFVAVDSARLLSRSAERWLLDRASFFFRHTDARRYSSATLFLTGAFLTLFLYPKPIASLAIVFATVGDLMAKYVGLEHGRTKILDRTLEGSLAYFLSCALAGALWSRFVPLSAAQVLVGSVAAALTETLHVGLDDNFTVPLISGAVMAAPAYFGVPGF